MKKTINPIQWQNNKLKIIDQTLLPNNLKYLYCLTVEHVYDAIKTMKVRGAPGIGIISAFGVYLAIKDIKTNDVSLLKGKINKAITYLSKSRPTAINLFWALKKLQDIIDNKQYRTGQQIKEAILKQALNILKEDFLICKKIGNIGKTIIKKNANVLTHCNAGALATSGYGTALGVIYASKKKISQVYVDETRPIFQGARLSVWELKYMGINTTLICDNMAAYLMQQKKIDVIIVGADRISINGDVANKIGTYNLAIIAKYHKIPFYVASPISTFDFSINKGSLIPIEQRSSMEIKKINNKYITVKNVNTMNPAFDVTPSFLITGIITEKGIIEKPNKNKINKLFKKCEN